MKDENVFAIRLKQCLKEKGLRQSDLQESLGLSRSTVSYYINGGYVPKADRLYTLATFFEVSPAWPGGLSDEKYTQNMMIGANIKQRRLEKGMSMAQLAFALGYHNENSIARLERGCVELKINDIPPIAKALGCTPASLLNWEVAGSSDMGLSEKEKQLILNYRQKTDIQKSVDILLGL